MPEQETLELLLGNALGLYCILASANKVTHGLILFPGDVDRSKFTCTMQAGKHNGITAVCLNPIAATLWNHGRSNYHALMPSFSQITVYAIAARSGFINEVKCSLEMCPFYFPNCFFEIGKITADSAIESNRCLPITFNQGYIDGIFVYIKANKYANIIHDSPPWLWLCAVGLIPAA